ncbi:MAG: hypothetical protein ACLGH1_08915 [Gammaproteobacteria bacterium]
MKPRQWGLAAALVATLAATWWAARVEDAGEAEVAAPVLRSARAPASASGPARDRAGEAGAQAAGELAIVREPWPASASDLLQPSAGARTQPEQGTALAVAPSAPPLPFTFIGSIERGGRRTVMLMEGEQLHLVGVRERIGERYRVERVTPTQIEFTYLPMQQRQVLETGQD